MSNFLTGNQRIFLISCSCFWEATSQTNLNRSERGRGRECDLCNNSGPAQSRLETSIKFSNIQWGRRSRTHTDIYPDIGILYNNKTRNTRLLSLSPSLCNTRHLDVGNKSVTDEPISNFYDIYKVKSEKFLARCSAWWLSRQPLAWLSHQMIREWENERTRGNSNFTPFDSLLPAPLPTSYLYPILCHCHLLYEGHIFYWTYNGDLH